MKKTIWLGCLFAFATVVYSCKSSTSPSKVAEDFAGAMIHNDFTKAKTLVLTTDQAMLDQGEAMSKSNPIADSVKTILDDAQITASNEKIENDTTASVDIKISFKKEVMGSKESTNPYILKKRGNDWKIDMTGTIKKVMESYGGNAAPPMDDSSMQSQQAPAGTDSLNQ